MQNVAILMMHFTSISNVKKIVLLEKKKCSPEFDFDILPEIKILFLFYTNRISTGLESWNLFLKRSTEPRIGDSQTNKLTP